LAENIKHAEHTASPPAAFEPVRQARCRRTSGPGQYFWARVSGPQARSSVQLAVFYGEAGEMDQPLNTWRALKPDPALVHLAVA
jgi:hypothetical protein